MAEKILNTRIQLKYDSYENWNSAAGRAVVLKKGEIGICAIPSGATAVNGDAVRPQILFKVGDGTSTFGALEWASAKAADVYSWAKQEALYTEKVGTGNVVANISWDATLNGGKGGIKFTTASVATSEGLQNLTTRVGNLETDVTALKDTYTDAEIDTKVGAVQTYAEGVADNLAEYEEANNNRVSLVETAVTTAENNAKTHANNLDTAMNTRVAALEQIDHTVFATKTEAQGYANGVADNLANYEEANNARVGAVEDDISVYKTSNNQRVGNVENTVAGHTALLNTIIGNEDENAVDLNSIKDLATWITEHGEDAAEMANAIQANTKAITGLGIENNKVANAKNADVAAVANDLSAALDTELANMAQQKADAAKDAAISDAAGKYYTAKNAEGLETRVEALEAIDHTAYVQQITTTANGGLKVTGKSQIDIDTSVIFVFDCGSSTVNI